MKKIFSLFIVVLLGVAAYADGLTPVTCAQAYGLAKGDSCLLNQVTVTYVNGGNVFVKDATGGFLIYKSNYGLKAGDVVTGLKGKIDIYSGLSELVPVAFDQLTVTAGTAPDPVKATEAPNANNLSQYVVYKKVVLEGEFTTAKSTTIVGKFNGEDINVFNKFKSAFTFEAGKKYDIVGVNTVYNGTYQTYFISATESPAYEVFYKQDYENGATADWITVVTGRSDPVLYTEEIAGGTNTYLATDVTKRNHNATTLYTNNTTTKGKTATPIFAAGTDFTMCFDLRLGCGNNQVPTFTVYDANCAQPILQLQATAKSVTTWKINGDATYVVDLPGSGYSKTTTQDFFTSKPWYNFQVTYVCGVTFLTVKDIAADTLVVNGMVIPTLTGVGGVGRMQWGTGRYFGGFAIDNVLIREPIASDYPQGYDKTTFSVNYLDKSGNAIKEARTGAIFAGFNITPLASDTDPVYTYDATVTDSIIAKKIYESGLDTIVADVDPAKNVINLVFRDANVYKVTCKSKGLPTELDFTPYDYRVSNKFKNVFEGETIHCCFPEFAQAGDSLWYKAAESQEYRRAITPTMATKETVEYSDNYSAMGTTAGSKIQCIPDIVFYAECEEIPTLDKVQTEYTLIRCSNGAGGFPLKNALITTLEPGTYRICTQDRSANNPVYAFAIGKDTISITGTAGTTTANTSADFTVTEKTDVVLQGLDSSYFTKGSALDWVYIQKVNRIPAKLVVSPMVLKYTEVGATDTLTWAADNPATPTFASKDPTIATVGSAGEIAYIAQGATTITVTLAQTVYYNEQTVEVEINPLSKTYQYVHRDSVMNMDETSVKAMRALGNMNNEDGANMFSSFQFQNVTYGAETYEGVVAGTGLAKTLYLRIYADKNASVELCAVPCNATEQPTFTAILNGEQGIDVAGAAGEPIAVPVVLVEGENSIKISATSDMCFYAAKVTYKADGAATGIQEVETEGANALNIYNLRGQKVNNMVKGQVYIINGHKFLAK